MTATNLPFAGGELSSFNPYDASCIESTSAGKFDPAWARCAIAVGGQTSGCDSPRWAEQSEFWFHAQNNAPLTWPGVWMFHFQNAAGTQVLRCVSGTNSNSTLTIRYDFYTLQGAVMTFVGSVTSSPGVLNMMDVQLVAGGSGALRVYMSGSLVLEATSLNHAAWAGVAQVSLRGCFISAGAANYWSEVICDGVPHIGDNVKTYPIDMNSATNTGWSGDVSDVNEIATNDSAFIGSTIAAQISTFYATGFSLGSYNIVSVTVSARAKRGTSGPQSLELALRTSATNYVSTPDIALDVGFNACSYTWSTNPHSLAAWLASAAQAVEGGVKSVA